MVEENIIKEFRFKKIDETRNYFLEEIEQNELLSRVGSTNRFVLL